MEKNLFEIATRNRYRFTYKGVMTIEDLWDLNVEALDAIFKALNRQKKTANEDSLLTTKSAEDTELANKIEIVKYIVSVKLSEAEQRKTAAANRERRQQILAIMAKKEDAKLENMDLAELEAELAKLG